MNNTMTQPVQIRPLGKRLVVKLPPREQVTTSGLVVPTKEDGKPYDRGEVIATGPDVTVTKNGQTVLFTKFAPSEATIDGTTFLLLMEDDILGVL